MQHLHLQTISHKDAQSQWIPSATLALGLIGPLHALASGIHPVGMPVIIIAQTAATLSVVTAAYLHVCTKNMALESETDTSTFEEFVARMPFRGHEPRVWACIAAGLTVVAAGVVYYIAALASLAVCVLSLVWVYRQAMWVVVKRSTTRAVDIVVRVCTVIGS
ncbi:hypothetical protein EXIGLDRAFT_761122 [Exidia glandulosa HHB12029]|uniref:Uncharacterized protein n=1 Tax=Exidia glandulosa HHB12029 TaxID=1314781 RepID=A0A165NRI8_EXIGL|nr:hypothetical protein EXIGLDRAFT_761122 [Exidia glandulosa HHB12029]